MIKCLRCGIRVQLTSNIRHKHAWRCTCLACTFMGVVKYFSLLDSRLFLERQKKVVPPWADW